MFFLPHSFLPLTAGPGCCWNPSFAMALQRTTEMLSFGCEHLYLVKEKLLPADTNLPLYSSCHMKQLGSA